jgi:hypothetical protein
MQHKKLTKIIIGCVDFTQKQKISRQDCRINKIKVKAL